MPKKPLNKIRIPFLEGSFPENPLPYKRLNRKGIKVSFLSNKKGVTHKIRRIQKNIIEQKTVSQKSQKTLFNNIPSVERIPFSDKTNNNYTVHSFINKGFLCKKTYKTYQNFVSNASHLEDNIDFSAKNSGSRNAYIKSNEKQHENSVITKYTFSLEQLKAELYKKQSQYKKSSSFKNVLLERKKCSVIYGSLGEKRIQKLILQAKHFDGKFDENFIKIVESRLDVALYRICFFPTIFSAKQWINHGHVLVNKKVNTLPGYQLKAGDVISISSEKKDILKKKISFYIAKKLKIRESHYFIKINNFYTVVKNLVKYQNKNFSLYINNKFLSTQSFEKKQKNIYQKDCANIPTSQTSITNQRFVLDVRKQILDNPSNTSFGSVRGLGCDGKQKKDFYQRHLTLPKGVSEAMSSKDLHFEESRKLVLFFKKSFQLILKSLHKNKIYTSLYLLPKVYPFSSLFLYQKVKERVYHKSCSLHPITSLTSRRDVRDVKGRHAKIFSIFYPFLKVKNLFTSARPLTQRVKSYKISGMKPLNLEVCYKNMVAIFLYSPQKVALPATIDLPLIGKNF